MNVSLLQPLIHFFYFFYYEKNVGLQVTPPEPLEISLSHGEKEPYLHWNWCLTAHEHLSPATDKPTALTPFISVLLMMT